MYARIAATYITAYCRETFQTDRHGRGPERMGSTMANGEMIDVFDHTGHGSHKYIPADWLTERLGEPQGPGMYGFWGMRDGSCLLLTCNGRLAYWDGKEDGIVGWAPSARAEENKVA